MIFKLKMLYMRNVQLIVGDCMSSILDQLFCVIFIDIHTGHKHGIPTIRYIDQVCHIYHKVIMP